MQAIYRDLAHQWQEMAKQSEDLERRHSKLPTAKPAGEALTASYSLLTGCMVEVGYLRVPEGSIREPEHSIEMRVNPHVIDDRQGIAPP
jgi:hypothetical protein